jgi:chromosome segregation ATPase
VCRRRFKQVPIGPIGAHLTLTDTKWAIAGEVVLGASLEMWLVDNKQDHQVCL